jgi:hypothetical protein
MDHDSWYYHARCVCTGTRTDWMVQQLAAAKPETKPGKVNVGQLQSYLLGNSYMKVLVHGQDSDDTSKVRRVIP